MYSHIITLIVFAGIVISCSDDRVRVYDIPKEEAVEQPFASPAPTMAPPASSGAELQWDVPSGWEDAGEKPMRLASYQTGEGEVDISVVRLGGNAGGLAANVNRWRGQVGLEPETEAKIVEQSTTLALEGIEVTSIELIGPESATLVAIAPHQGQSWFFKLTGPRQRVENEREQFESWLKSIRIAKSDGGENRS
jgi:hypothetical protein